MSDTKKRRGWDDGRDADSRKDQSSSKKPKVEPSSNGDKSSTNGAGKPLPAKPAVSLDVLEKAKKALQLQKQLQEKLKKLPVRLMHASYTTAVTITIILDGTQGSADGL